MHVITTLRSLLAAPGRGLTRALLIAVVIAGVVLMHSMSGSPTAHLPPPGVAAAHDAGQSSTSGETSAHATSGQVTSAQSAVPAMHNGLGDDCPSGCGSHDAHHMTTAMCLMVLVVLLTLAARPASFCAVLLPLARRALVVEPHSRPAPAPSLHALGISRT